MSLPIIIVTGPAGSGKSTAARLLAANIGARLFNVGDLLRSYLAGEGVYPTEKSAVGPMFIERHGRSMVFELMRRHLEERREAVIYDGVRLELTCRQMLDAYPESKIWLVQSPRDQCRYRLRQGFCTEGITIPEIDAHIDRATLYDNEQVGIQAIADVMIVNEKSLDDLSIAVHDAIRLYL
jgi:dephospho-CoA kinase